MIRVVVSDPMAKEGLDLLRASGLFEIVEVNGGDAAALNAALAGARALLVRSGTKATAAVIEAAPELELIGRAGTGVDNVDVEAATRRGVVVMNTPDANSIAAAEQTMALLLALLRNTAPAAASMAAGRWDRTKFLGAELAGKTLGVVGFGRIGREVARRARAFDMEILVFDPFVTDEGVRAAEARLVPMAELLREADVVTLHLPLTKGTRHLVGAEALRSMKKGSWLVNCARGGLVDEAALLAALDGGPLAGAAFDVFEEEPPPADHPLRNHPKVLVTPHLGASTREAQENVSVEIARQVTEYFESGAIRNAVNMPSLSAEAYREARPALDLVERLGILAGTLVPGALRRLSIDYRGEAAALPLPALTLAGLKGVLSTRAGESVNYVNARLKAKEGDLDVVESFDPEVEDHPNLFVLTLEGDAGRRRLLGTLVRRGEARLVGIDDYRLEAEPRGTLLVLTNADVPGVVGAIGTRLGEAGVNIARISWGRDRAGGTALTIIHLDEAPKAGVVDAMAADPRVSGISLVRLPD